MARRINRVIELLEDGQPAYYTGAHSGADISYEAGRAAAGTWADYLNIGFEHGAFDLAGLDAFMRGLVDGGPTRSGHRTPVVIVEAPVDGATEETVRANAWQFRQILARGVHGIILCHAETPGAVRAFVESCRFPFQTAGVGEGLEQGRRGAGGQAAAAPIWGVSQEEYLRLADPWPLNPDGELLLGLKFENPRALANAEVSAKVPGVGYAEWGPGDQALALGYAAPQPEPYPEDLLAIRSRVFAACRDAGVAFLDAAIPTSITSKLDEGVRIVSSVDSEETARIGRAHTGRTLPV